MDHRRMDDVITLVSSAVLSGLVALVVSRYTSRHNHRLERRARAIEKLVPHLYELQDLVIVAHPGMVTSREVSGAVIEWNRAWKTYRVGLPREWGFIYRESLDAIGNFLGPQRFAAVDRRVHDAPLDDYQWEWQANAEYYLGHLAACVARCDERRPPRPLQYEAWLAANDVRSV